MAMPFLLLMPSYNQAHFIHEAVNSVLAQDDPDWELWIVDNSSDDTPRVMQGFSDPRIRYHHIPARMDPGSCLNWMLERAQGRDFSYVHTDNNLHPGYVRHMRAALAADPLSLAYCDMKVIDGAGQRTAVSRRGAFDLPRLLSLGPLGVPFSATTELARQLGGFSTRDLADDVRFCTLAYGLARFVHLREPLIDYRLHETSRTEDAGGVEKVRRWFLRTHASVLPQLETRGLQPLKALGEHVRSIFDDLDWLAEDLWYRKFAGRLAPWWSGEPRLDPFFQAGLIRLPGWTGGPARPWHGYWAGRWHSPFTALYLMARLSSVRRVARKRRTDLRDYLLPWAWLSLGDAASESLSFRVRSLDARTLWGARLLQLNLGWTPSLDAQASGVPDWLGWARATGGEPLLDLSGEPRFGAG